MDSEVKLESKPVYAILGAYGGIGSTLVRHLAPQSRLFLGGRVGEKLEALAEEVGASWKEVDATDSGQVREFFQAAREEYGKIDGVANCVGSMLLKPAHGTSEEEWEEVVKTNLYSAFYTVKSAVRSMMKDGGTILLVSSAAAQVGLPNHEAIGAAKAGVIGLTLAAASTYASKNIRVNCVAPGMVDTPMTKNITENESMLRISEAIHPLGRIGRPEDIVRAMTWMLDPEQDWVTGQVLSIDGGLSKVRGRQKAKI